MFYLFVLLAVLLSLSLLLSAVREGRFRTPAKIFRILTVSAAVAVFVTLFVQRSVNQFRKDTLAVQVINKLPRTLDFYLIKVNADSSGYVDKYETRHLGSIRSNFYRLEYEDMKHADELWLAGIMGKKEMVYFSQHYVPNKNEDQIIEVRNYINQSLKLSQMARAEIAALKSENIKTAIWITLDLLLLFLNVVLLFRKNTRPK